MPPYERFDAWKLSHELVLSVYQATGQWPKVEQFGLTSQARRSATSVPLNIVEGSSKRGSAEFRRFLDIANGSLGELGYILRLAHDLKYMPAVEWQQIEQQRDRAARAVWGLYRSLKPRQTGS